MKRSSAVKLTPTWEWRARWTSYWYGDREVFDFTARDFDRRAAALRRAGINAVITFGGFHFRWSFVDEWPLLLRTLKHICRSCHRHGIKVVEHHSALLTWNPIGTEDHRFVNDYFGKLAYPINIRWYPGFLRQMETGDALHAGCWLSGMRQIDPRTGQFARTNYRGWALCFNNPDWQRQYFRHLRDIYACDVDGIMTDDIQFWPVGYGCGCPHCRALFHDATGYRLPVTGSDAPDFYGNAENPSWRRWILWRMDCHRAHQRRVIEHARRYGANVMRPIYSSSNSNAYAPRGMGTALDNLGGLYSTVFTEVNQTDLQAHCWLRIGAESSQRRALAVRNHVPSMCLFYPNTPDENLFCWAMTKAWGQRYWGTNWRMGVQAETRMLRSTFRFETQHADCYGRLDSPAEVGVLFPARSVWLHKDNDQPPDYIRMSDPASTDCWAGWCELLALANIPFDTILEDDLAEGLHFDRLRLIIIPNAVCMSIRQIEALKAFVWSGGAAIITHQAGLKDEMGAPRKKWPLAGLTGAEYKGLLPRSPAWRVTPSAPLEIRGGCAVSAPTTRLLGRAGTAVWARFDGGVGPALVFHKYGKGAVVTCAGKPGRVICINRHARFERHGHMHARVDFDQNPALTDLMRQTALRLLAPAPQLIVEGAPRGCLVSIFTRGKRLMIHVVNATGTLADSGKTLPVPVRLKFPRLERLPGGARLITINVRHTGARANLVSPEFQGARCLSCIRQGGYALIELPARAVKCYGMIVVE